MAKKANHSDASRTLAANRSAGHEFQLLERLEAGLVLNGTEVKSARLGTVSLKESYAKIERGEAFLVNAHFSPYEQGNRQNVDPVRKRKLLLHAREIRKLERATQSGGTTLVPTRLYLKDGRVKVEIAVARAKKAHDKREAIAARDARREMDRARAPRRRD